MTFTTGNWDTAQTVQVTAGQDDDAIDEEVVTITHAVSSSADSKYDGLSAGSVAVSVTDDDTAGVTISETALDIEEGDSDTYTVVLDSEPAGDVTVAIGGVAGTDLTLDKPTLTFTTGNWDTAQTVQVTAGQDDDAVDEDVVSITHAVSSTADSDYDGLAAGSVAVSVIDDDTVGVTISETALEIDEGDSDTYTVVLDTEPVGDVTVTIGGVAGTDLTLDKPTLTFTTGNWDTAQTVQVTAEQDADAVDEDVVSITHAVSSTADSDYDGLAAGSVAVSVTDDDTVGVTISETALEIDEGDSDTYTVVLDTEPVGDVTVTLGGVADTDLTLDKTTLTFTTGNWDTAQTVQITAEQDADAVDEDVVSIAHAVSSTADSDYDGLSAGSVAVTVTDDETPSAELTLTMAPPTHGDTDGDGKVNLGDTLRYMAVATNSGNVPLEDVNVKDALINTSGTECTSLPLGATCTSTVTYTIVQADVERGSVSNTATATATAVVATTVTRQTAVDQVEELELEKTTTADGFAATGESISYSYKVTNTGTVTLSGTLEIDDDKIAAANITCPAVPGTGMAPGAFLTCTGSYTAVQADVDAGKVTNEATASLAGVTSAADSVTVNWQAPQGSQPQLSVGSGENTENAGSFTFTVILNPASLQTVTVDYATSDGTATAGSDYTADSGTLTFAPGDTTKNVTVTIADDDLDESDETFNLTLSDAVNASLPIPTGTFTIRDDDTAGVTVSDTSVDVDEGDSDTYTVVLDSQPTHSVTITVNDPSNTDVTAEPASLTFTTVDWDTAQTVTVTASQDAGHDDEDGTVTHTAASTDTKYDGIAVADVLVNVIDDDDVSVTVSFGSSTYAVAEGNTVAVKVKLSADPERTVEVPITVTTMDGAEAADFSGVPAKVVFDGGDTEKTFDFEAVQDTVDDDGERVRLTFGTLPARVSSTSPSQAVVSITDDDVPSVTVSFEQDSYVVAEGSSVTVKVKLDADPERAVTIPLTKTHVNGATNSDYMGVPANVVFNSGDTEKTFAFAAESDSDNDDGESVKLGFTNLPAGVSAGTTDETTVSITDDDVPAVTVSFEENSYAVAEGDSVTVTVKLSADPERTVTIPLTATGQGGATSADYTVPASVVFNSGDTEKTFSFTAADDAVDDDGESVKLGFTNLPTGVSAGATDETIVSITDDDVPAVTVSFEEDAYTVAEGDSVTVKVVLSADPERTVAIPLLRVNQGGATSSDYSNVPAEVEFNSGETETTFTFTAASDADNDDGESVRVSFGTLPEQVSAGTHSGTTVSITDDDVPAVTVSFEQDAYTVAEGNSTTVTVVLSADPERTVTIPLTATGQNGATGADYNVPANVVFNRGDTEKTFSFTAADDAVDDDGESVKLGFTNLPAGVSAGTIDETTVSITDDDVPAVTVSFEENSYAVAEGDSVTVTVVLSADPERTVTIPLTATNQGGAASADYNVPASVAFNSGDTEKTFSFTAADDAVDDDGESVKLGFVNLPAGVSAGTIDETTISITDDDVPSVTVSFEETAYSVPEGSSIAVKVRLSADPERTVEIPISVTDMDGASSSDYSVVPQTTVFNSGDTEKTLTFSATDDAEDDDGERVRLNFGALPPRVSSASPSQAVVSITDDDVPAVTVSFEENSYAVAEGDSVTVKVVLSADPERTVTIPLTATGQNGATSADYNAPASVVFDSGDTEKTLTFTAADDAVDDDGESVKLGFTNLPAGASAGTTDETTVSITDDDVPAVTVSFEQDAYTVAEGNSVTVTVKLSADPERTVTIPLTATGQNGATSADYNAPASVVFDSGDTEKTFSFTATDDAIDDDGESVKLGFTNLPGGVSAGTTDETTVSITDDDVPAVTVSFEENFYAVAEGDSVTVTVRLSADPERTVTIPLTATGQNGATSADYTVPANVVFNSGDTEKTFSFTAADDAVDDDGESVKLGFTNLPTGVSAGATDETAVSITDDDVPAVTVSFEENSYAVAEGNSVTVTVKLSADPERTVTIPLTATNQNGATSADYNAPASVVFDSGDTEKTFSFTATDDAVDDDGESVKLGFTNLPTGVSAGATDETAVSITDDDVPAVTVSFEENSYAVAEGNSVTVTVKLSADPERTVTIPLTATNQNGATSADYNAPASVVFDSGDTEKTFSFTATDDAIDDDGESVKLGFTNLPGGVSAGTTDETTVSITDDDVPAVTVSFEEDAYTVAEGDSVTVTVVLSADPERTVTIPLTKTNQGGAATSDYSPVPANVVFHSGDTEKTFLFSATDDGADDDGESVKLGFGILPAGVSAGATDESTVSIADNDVPSVAVSFEETAYTVPEGSSIAVKVRLSADPERTMEVPISVTNMDGASSGDYSVAPQTVVFNSGDTEKTLTFSAADDAEDDDGERVRLSFGALPARVSSTSPSQAVVSIGDDDTAGVTISETSLDIDEGDFDTYTVVLDTKPAGNVTVTMGGLAGTDLSLDKAALTFTTGNWNTAQTVRVTAEQDDDAVDEAIVNITHAVSSSGDSDYDGLAAGRVAVSVTDDDAAGVTVSATSLDIDEGDSDTYTVVLDSQPTHSVTITVSDPSNTDVTAEPASLTFTTVNWDTAQTVTVTAAQDAGHDDEDGTVTHTAVSTDTKYDGISVGDVLVNVTDDDDVPVSVGFGSPTHSVVEGESVTVTVTLSADPERTVTIPITRTNQDDASDSDYSGVPSEVVFDSGETEKTFDVEAIDDDEDDNDESVKLTFGGLPAGVTEGTTKETVLSIVDNDGGREGENKGLPEGEEIPVTVNFAQASYTATEGGAVTVTVTLSADPERSVSIPLTITNGTGATAGDYSGVPASVDFVGGETEKSFVFTAEQDDIDEDAEEVTLGFDTLPDGVSAGTTAQAVVTIADSIHVSFGASNYYAYEGGSGALVTVELDRAPVSATVIPITAVGMNGATSADWTGVPNSLTFGPGQSARFFTVMAYDDTVEDGGERVQLGFGDLPPGVARGVRSTASVELMNMEVPQVSEHSCPPDAGERIILERFGQITQGGEADFWRVKLDLHRGYIIEVLGKDSGLDVMDRDTYSGDLTLEDPVIVAIWNDGRTMRLRTGPAGSDNGGNGRNSLTLVRGVTPSGWHEIEVHGKGGAGSYQIKVRVNNVCRIVHGNESYSYFGGPDGFVLDVAGDGTTDTNLMTSYTMNWRSITGYLGDNWSWYRENEPDVDWIRVHLKANHEYAVEVWTEDHYAREYQATDLKILGIYDANGVQIPGTAGAGSGVKVTLNFEPDTDGTYYVAVGSGAGDRTGMYAISVEGADTRNSRARALNLPASGGPRIEGSPQTGQALVATTSAIKDEDGLSRAVFAYQWIRYDLATATAAEIKGATGKTYTATSEDEGKALKVRVTFTDDNGNAESLTSAAVIISPAPNTRAEAANAPATGAPAIEGAPTVGQTLTATTSKVADDDGVSRAAFAYQWLADGVAIDGANSSTYTVVPGDQGRRLRVRVDFTDDAGNEESLTSKATAAVAAAPAAPLTASLENEPTSHDGQKAFTFELRFSEHIKSLSYVTLRDHAFTVIGGEVKKAQRVDPQSETRNIHWRIKVKPDGDGDVTIVLPATTRCGAQGAICTGDGRKLSTELELTVAGPGS